MIFFQAQLIKMLFAFREELSELVNFRRCCSADNLWELTLSIYLNIDGADVLNEPLGSNIGGGGLEPLMPHEVGATAEFQAIYK